MHNNCLQCSYPETKYGCPFNLMCETYEPYIYREFHGVPYTESKFQASWRFSEESIEVLTNLLYDLKRPTHRGHVISVDVQIKIALTFYALGSFLQVIGYTFEYNQSTVSRLIQAVTGLTGPIF